MIDVGRTKRNEIGVIEQVHVAIRHAEPGLADTGDVDIAAAVVLTHSAIEELSDAVASGVGREQCITRAVVEPADFVEPRLDRRHAPRFDRRLVEEARISGADRAARIILGCVEDVADALLAEVLERGERAIVRLVGGNERVLGPGPVGEAVKIVAGANGAIHSGAIEAVSAKLGLGRWRRLWRDSRHRNRRCDRRRSRSSAAAGQGGGDQREGQNTKHLNSPQNFRGWRCAARLAGATRNRRPSLSRLQTGAALRRARAAPAAAAANGFPATCATPAMIQNSR